VRLKELVIHRLRMHDITDSDKLLRLCPAIEQHKALQYHSFCLENIYATGELIQIPDKAADKARQRAVCKGVYWGFQAASGGETQ
jgi:hypothetical protein